MIIIKTTHGIREEDIDTFVKDAEKFGFQRSDPSREWSAHEKREAVKYAIGKIVKLHIESKC